MIQENNNSFAKLRNFSNFVGFITLPEVSYFFRQYEVKSCKHYNTDNEEIFISYFMWK